MLFWRFTLCPKTVIKAWPRLGALPLYGQHRQELSSAPVSGDGNVSALHSAMMGYVEGCTANLLYLVTISTLRSSSEKTSELDVYNARGFNIGKPTAATGQTDCIA